MKKKNFFWPSKKVTEGRSRNGYVSQKYGTADPDPAPKCHGPQHYLTFPRPRARDLINSAPPAVRMKFARIFKCLQYRNLLSVPDPKILVTDPDPRILNSDSDSDS
jgi:hypothetical protein